MTCGYCGATLVDNAPPVGKHKTLRTVVLEAVGPSNRDRVAHVIAAHTSVELADAVALVARTPCEVFAWEDHQVRADDLRRALIEAGATASVGERIVVIPPPIVLPPRRVTLDAVGAQRVAVLKVVREHLDCGLAEAKHLVDAAPCTLIAALEGSRALAFRDALIAAGALASAI